jgi:predicted RNase H-like HicB family nuclease
MATPFPYRVVIRWSDEDSAYIAEVPELPGCIADGASPEAAIKEGKKAARLWTEVAKKEKRNISRPLNRQDAICFKNRRTLWNL